MEGSETMVPPECPYTGPDRRRGGGNRYVDQSDGGPDEPDWTRRISLNWKSELLIAAIVAAVISTVMMRFDKHQYLSAHAKTQGMVGAVSDTVTVIHRDVDSVKMLLRRP